jgi:hypothetical protein
MKIEGKFSQTPCISMVYADKPTIDLFLNIAALE